MSSFLGENGCDCVIRDTEMRKESCRCLLSRKPGPKTRSDPLSASWMKKPVSTAPHSLLKQKQPEKCGDLRFASVYRVRTTRTKTKYERMYKMNKYEFKVTNVEEQYFYISRGLDSGYIPNYISIPRLRVEFNHSGEFQTI